MKATNVLLVLLLGWASLAAGCWPQDTPEPVEASPSRTPSLPQTRTPRPTATATPIAPAAPQTLTLWVTESVSPLQGGEAAQALAQQIAAFEATHPGLTVQLLHKKPDGTGGLREFLTTASAVAPTVLPDLIAVDTATLPELARKGLVVPLDGIVSEATQADLYPFAVQACTVDEHLVGIQFEVENAEHALYNPSKIAVAPLTWTEVFSSGATYIFPAAGQNGLVNDAFLIQYLSAGGKLVDAKGEPALNRRALIDVLTFYQQGIERGAILTDVLGYVSVENCWPKYLQAGVVMSNITSNLYLAVRTGQVTAAPTRDGQAVVLTRGHAWALTARDPRRRSLAAKLLEWLIYPANMAAWSQAAGRVPARRAAFEQMARDPYVVFMHNQLEKAVPYATSEIHQRIYRAMQQAVVAVLRDRVSPESAADSILKAVNQRT